ncbi:MAG: DNA-binding response regulator [Chloroflexi bacterium]|nr:MAG: DNA-binding response regulator [Chloroflexota bacterium]
MSTVLVVEDDAGIRDAVAYNLGLDGHAVLTASDGASGLELARTHHPDAVVLDVMLPRMSGLDVCRILRAETPVPILLLTARDAEPDRVQGLELGADDYVTKPFSMRELRARVGSMLRRDDLSRQAGPKADEVAHAVTAGRLTLDPTKHELRRDGAVVPLRPREFALLEYLMRHPDQVLTRDQILESVWGITYRGETRTVDVHVRWLREKIEDEPARPEHILTVRSIGYKFVP